MNPIRRIFLVAIVLASLPLAAQLNENCTVSVLNRSVQVDADGSWVLPNVPTNVGFVRARATCVENGVTRSGQSDYFLVPPDGVVEVAEIVFETIAPIPANLVLTAPTTRLGNAGATVQVTATATYANGTTGNISLAAQGTNWFTSNPRIATVSADGLVTAAAVGNVLISAMNEGALGMLQISIVSGGDADGDGLPDEFEIGNGLDPNNPADAAGDLDSDGLSNLEEFQRGTDLRDPDSDSDGLRDGEEVTRATNPLLADTDGDGVRDGLEVQTGSNPLDPNSYNLAEALQSIAVAPNAFEIVVNTLVGEASRIVAVTGNLKDGTTLDLTARSRGTAYSSSNLNVISFGAIDGQIFGGQSGTATLTVTNGGHSATATVTVRTFAPQSLSFLAMPGFANNVDVDGNYAYVAAGSAGLVIVNVTNRAVPNIVTTVDTPGNANDVRVVAGYAYVADGASGLQVIDISNPNAPRIVGSFDTNDARDVVVSSGTAYVADGSAGLTIIDVRNPVSPSLTGSVDTLGTAKGVDVAGRYAIVADGGAVRVIDITDPTQPALAGAVAVGDARDVVAEGTYAYVADFGSTLRVISFANPSAPQIVATADRTLAGIPTDVAKVRELVFVSDVLFVNGVSVTDVRSPNTPTVRARLDFPQRDDNGTGLALDHQFVYLTAEQGMTENGTSGDTRLYIGQYLFAEDTGGIAPTVRLTSPVQQPTAVEGGTLRLAATAADDVLVARVDFLVNGEIVATDTAEPYDFQYRIPNGLTTLAIQARATDIADNSAITPQVIMSVIPDPGTTAIGVVALENGTGVSGANVTCAGRSTVSVGGGNFSISSIPTITGEIRCSVSYNGTDGVPYIGSSNLVTAIPGGTTNVGTITLRSALGYTKFPMTSWGVDSNFRALTINREGNTLAVTKYSEDSATGGGNDQMVLLDISDPSRPTHLRTVRASVGATYDVELKDGWAYIAGHDFCTFQFSNPSAGRRCISQGYGEIGVAYANGYAYTSTGSGDGRLRLFDVSNPDSPRYIREQSLLASVNFRDIDMLGSRYVVAFTEGKPGGIGHDVVVIDVRDPNHWVKVADFDIPNFDAFRGEVRGNYLYLTSTANEIAIVDLSTPTAPQVAGRRTLGGSTLGLFPINDELFVAVSAAGLTSLDITTPAAPVETRTLSFGTGSSADVTVANSYAYVAGTTELIVAGLAMAPQVDVARIAIERNGSVVTVRGAAGAVTGQQPVTVGAANAVSGASVSGIAVAADGSFSATLPAATGEAIDLTATDVAGRTTGPVRIGVVPFGNASFLPFNRTTAGGSFRARTLAANGSMLVVTGFAEEYGPNPNALIYDISNPAAPAYQRTAAIVNGQVYDLELVDGWAYVGGHDFCTIQISNPNATRTCVSQGYGEVGVAVSGRYAFTGTASSDGRLRVFDISNPAAPRYLYERSYIGSVNFHDVLAYGSNYLIATSPYTPGGVGHDVVVFDRRDVNNIVKIADLDIPGFNANRGRIYGNRLYLASNGEAKSAIVDLSNPAAPVVISIVDDGAMTRGIDATGPVFAVANGAAGITVYDAANAAAPVVSGRQVVGGSAWDVLYKAGALYVANELGLVTIADVAAPPVIDTARVEIELATSTTVTVSGAARAISGTSPLAVEVRNTSSGVSVTGVAVAADGSFSATVAARPGEALALVATDGNGRVTGPVAIGAAPFGSGTSSVVIPVSAVGDAFRARTLAAEGNLLVVTGFYEDYGTSPKGVVFDISNPRLPVFQRAVDVANGHAYEVALRDGWAYVAGHDFCTIQISNPAASRTCVSQGYGEVGVALMGGFAITSTAASDGRLRVFDVSNPAAPRYLYERSFIGSVNFHDLVAYGTDYLVGITPHRPGNVGHDVVVFDARDVNNIVKVADIDIPNFNGNRGRIYGNLLYVASEAGPAVAIVDLADPRAPRVLSTPAPGGSNRGISAAGTVAATADGTLGVTFHDVADPSAPVILGTQFVAGNAWDTLFSAGSLYVANELGLVVIQDVVGAPIIDIPRIVVAPATESTATVSGLDRAITGQQPLTLTVHNTTANTTVQNVAVSADGSFSVTIGARAGEVIAIVATDGNGRTAGPVNLGGVPFGSEAKTILVPRSSVGDSFRARTLAAEGDRLLVTGFYDEYGQSAKGVLYDISDPKNPELKRVVDIANGHAYDIEIENGWAFVGGFDFCTINLADPASTRNCISQGYNEVGIALSGGYAITGTASSDGRLRVFDVSNPAAPRYLYERSFIGSVNFHDVVAYGTDYVIGISPHRPGNIGRDVVVFDIRNINHIVKVKEIDIPNFDGNRAHVYGTMLYVASNGGSSTAILDMSDPRDPQLRSVVATGGTNRGVTATGSMAITADGTAGITFIDTSDPSAPAIAGRQHVGGNAWDTLLSAGTLYVANEHGVVVIPDVAVPPIVDLTAVTVTAATATEASVTGSADAVTGDGPISVALRNEKTNVTGASATVSANGAFSASIDARPGDVLTLIATDRVGRVTAREAGSVPFGVASFIDLDPSVVGANFRARTLATEGNLLVLNSFYEDYGPSPKAVVFDITDRDNPVVQRTVDAANGHAYDIQIVNGWGFVAGHDFCTINFADPSSVRTCISQGYNEIGVAVSGQYAFTSASSSDGRIRIFNIANPAAPVYVREQSFIGSVNFHDVIAYGTDYLVATTPHEPGGIGHDVVVFDRRNINSLVKVADLNIPNFKGMRGEIVGTTLYLTSEGGDSVALVDLTTPSAPVLISRLTTGARNFGVAAAGSAVVSADSSTGIHVFDVTTPGSPIARGRQWVGGNAHDVLVVGDTMYVANEHGLVTLRNIDLP